MVRKPLLLTLLLAAFVYADTGYKDTIQITETDGSPMCMAGKVKFSAGTVTCSGQVATVTNTGGGGGGGGAVIAVNNGTSGHAEVNISSPTNNVNFNSNGFVVTLQGTATSFVSLSPTQGSINTFTSSQTFNGSGLIVKNSNTSTPTIFESVSNPAIYINQNQANLPNGTINFTTLNTVSAYIKANGIQAFSMGVTTNSATSVPVDRLTINYSTTTIKLNPGNNGLTLDPADSTIGSSLVTPYGMRTATFTVTNAMSVSSNTVLPGTTFYQNGNVDLGTTLSSILIPSLGPAGNVVQTGAGGVLTAGSISITGNTTGVLTAAKGGTGLNAAGSDEIMIGNGTTWQSKSMPSCLDTGGNHLNYDDTANILSCGTSSSGGGSSIVSISTGVSGNTFTATSSFTVLGSGFASTYGITTSSIAAGSFVAISSNVVMSGTTFYQGGNATIGTAGSTVVISSNAFIAGATFYQGSTVDISSLTVANQFKINQAIFISTGPIVRSTYTLTSTDSVILASATPNGNITINVPASVASNGGQFYSITKVDKSTAIVTVQLASTDLIANTTGTVTLNAPGQRIMLVSDGTGGWQPVGGFPITPAWLGDPTDPNGGSAIQVANDARCQAYTNTDFAIATGVRFSIGAQSGNMDVGIYDNKGARLVSSGSTAVPAIGVAGITFAGRGYMAPGPIWICVAIDNITATLRCPVSGNLVGACEIASSFPLPATLAIPNCTAATKKFAVIATVQGSSQN